MSEPVETPMSEAPMKKHAPDESAGVSQAGSENALFSSIRLQEELQLIFDSAPVMIWYKDTQNRILRVNRMAADSINLPKDQIEGRAVAELYPEEADRYYQDDLIVMRTGKPRLGIIEPYRLPGGEQRWIQTDKVPMKNEAGDVVGILVLAQDITERKRAEEALMASERRFSLFMQNLPGLAWLKDALGRYCYVNEAAQRVFRRSTQDLYGKTDREVFSAETAEQFIRHDREALARASGIHTVETLEHPDGVHFSLVAKFPIHTGCGEAPFIGGIGIDITDRIRMEQQLKASQERLQVLTDKLEQLVEERTHELVQSRDELRGLATELNLTEQRERRKLATELHDHLQQALVLGKLKMGQSKRFAAEMPALARIIEETDAVLSDALQYTRTLVAELSPPVLRDHGLAAGLKWLAEYMKKHEMSVAVTVPDGDDLRLPEDQAVLLFQCVRELLINSSKHAGTGNARVTMERGDGNVRIVVGDDGAGFDLAAAAIATTGASGGTTASKFGLFSIRERMRALGGSFHIESSPGQGTTATLLLPLAAKASVAKEPWTGEDERRRGAAVSDKSPLSTVHSSLIRVLLVDDHVMVRQGLRSVLDAYADMQVVGEARDGIEAVKLVEELRPRVVVMDINMPNMNGIEATTRIKAQWPETTIIGISVNSGGDNSAAMQRAGAVSLLTKEAAVEQLYDIITEAVKKSKTAG
jgi:PAS domain S-box-containing protein